MATSLFLTNNDLCPMGGCWPWHPSMPLMQSEVSRWGILGVFHSTSSLNLPYIQSLVTGWWKNDGFIGVENHFIDGASMARQLIQNLPACGIPHIHKSVGWSNCHLASIRWPRPSRKILFKVLHIFLKCLTIYIITLKMKYLSIYQNVYKIYIRKTTNYDKQNQRKSQ